MTQYIKRLPTVFQTVTEKKFFDATFDQVFSKKDSDMLAGYLGRRDPGSYNPITDFYLPEPSKNRTWWQLEPTAYARNADTTKSNIFFYEDLLENIEYYGGNTLNQDRLFESEYYSFGPPIDYDMFINYQNYYWVEQGLAVINISGVLASEIIGQPSFTTGPLDIPPNFTLSTGMTISLLDDPDYVEPHIVENFGGCEGLGLVQKFPDVTAGTLFEFLPWDGDIELSTGRVIHNEFWSINPWETQASPGNGDYITIERGALDRNAWSRTNKWFHIDAINKTVAITGTPFPTTASRALRPIIQFVANIPLYKSGTQFRETISYGFGTDLAAQPITLAQFNGQPVAAINLAYNIELADLDLVCWFDDVLSNNYIWEVHVDGFGILSFTQWTSVATPVLEGDIVFIAEDGPYNSSQRGQTWYYEAGIWQEVFNEKITTNQPPLFLLYDHNNVELDDPITYSGSTFRGSKIFSYKVNQTPGATVDPVLKFPIVYTSLGQASDIIFQNNLITDRYTYSAALIPIDGYYYYNVITGPVLFNNWNLYDICDCDNIVIPPPANCIELSKQRVIDKFVVGFGSEFSFRLSVTPYGYETVNGTIQPLADIVVSVNGLEVKNEAGGYEFTEINNRIYIDLTAYLTNLLLTTQSQPPVVEAQTYTHGLLDPAEPGYFEIPQQLEANPTQLEISEISGSDLIQQFSSIISNQIGFTGSSFGGINNYRDSRKNRTVGSYILQNLAPALKSMLVSSEDDLDFIKGVRFSSDEYTKFKNKFLTVALQLINQGFNPLQYFNNTIDISAWVGEILRILNVSKEFSNAFAYSFMAAQGTPSLSENIIIPLSGLVTLTNYVDLSNPRNIVYFYDITTATQRILTVGTDYDIVGTNLAIDVQFNIATVPPGSIVYAALYQNPVPTYIPSTPTKVGAWGAYTPRIELDATYAIPTDVIIGHDGSKTIAYGDYRDSLLLDLETRIYNSLQQKFRSEYYIPLRLESVKSGFFRQTRYSHDEYLEITESYLNKWSAKNRANYRVNDWPTSSLTTPVGELWKLYNYRPAATPTVSATPLPGNWKGIFQYYYDTYYPDTSPWEMLGFSQKPSWWEFEYGPPVLNIAGQEVWTSLAAGNNIMWADLEFGIIRQGPTAIYDPVSLLPQEQAMWARPGLSSIVPVDIFGEIIPIITLFGLPYSGNPFAPFDHFDDPWIYGDGSPVEQAWMSTSGYAYSSQEFLYLMKPGPFGELLWDTLGTELSPGTITDPLLLPGIELPVMSNKNWQYVQNTTFAYDDPFFAWMRPKNKDQIVHAEIVDGVTEVRFGYQVWISDRILFLGKSIADTFGQKVRTLDVNLANKLAGFINKDTTNTYISSVTPGANTNTLIIPSTNFDVFLHKSPVVDTYSYSGIIIRALIDGTFVVYGYDLLNAEFITLDRTTNKLIDITIGGTPVEFRYFESGATYNQGEIVRYNGVYYESLVTQTVQKFIASGWQKLKGLPTIGGVSVTYKPISAETITRYPYGSILKNTQEVFDLMIGWGAYLETQGWQFTDVNQDTNILNDWLSSAKQFLFWLNTNWAPDASIQLSPLANSASLIVKRGYPNDVESLSNGVYSILDKFGVAIPPNTTTTDRDGPLITVAPANLSSGGIYFLQVNTSETEHVLIFDNVTNFNDVIYTPLLRARQQRLRFNGFRSNGWYGKMEAPGYLIIDNQLVPNYDTIVDSMRYFYDSNVTIDNPSLEDLGRHLIGYESKSYLDNLQVSNDVQYLLYQGAIRQKGTKQSFEKLFRSTKVQSNEIIKVFEEWALKLGDFGNTIEQVSTEFRLIPEQNTGEVIVARLNFVPSEIGFVRQINILNAQNTYINIPKLVFAAPDATPSGAFSDFSLAATYAIGSVVKYDDSLNNPVYYSSNIVQGPGAIIPQGNPIAWTPILETRIVRAYVVLDATNRISRVDITDPGYGYLSAPLVSIDSGAEPHNLDKLYSVWQGEIISDVAPDNIINIDIDEVDKWVIRPTDPTVALEFPLTNNIDYPLPNAGYVNFNDVTLNSFDTNQVAVSWGTTNFNPVENNTIWIAKTFTEDWDVYKMIDITTASVFDVIENAAGDLFLRTDPAYLITPQFTGGTNETDFGNLLSLQVIEAQATLEINGPAETATATALVPFVASSTANIISGEVAGLNIVSGGAGYTFVPQVSIDIPSNETAQASAVVTAGVVTSLPLSTGGFGYIVIPAVTIDPPNVINATATSSINNGSVESIILTNNGLGYYSVPSVTISPPTLTPATANATIADTGIETIDITNNGAGYIIAPTVTISAPNALITATGDPVIVGGVVKTINITNTGLGYDFAPLVTINDVTGVGATAVAIISGGIVTGFNITNGGTGYVLVTTTITIAAPTGNQATATAIVADGIVTGFNITDIGSGYSSATISIDIPTGSTATASATISNGTVTGVSIISSGGGYISPPTVTIGLAPVGTPATATATIAAGVVTGFVIAGGSGYTSIPAVTIADPTNVNTVSTAIAVVDAGIVTSIIVTEPGSGFIITPTVTIEPPLGNGTVFSTTITNPGAFYTVAPAILIAGDGVGASATTTITDGQVTNIIINQGGVNYTFATLTIAPPPAPSGAILGATITKSGANYNVAPVVTINANGPGVGATAHATIAGGVVSEIIIDTAGSGYTSAATIEIALPPSVAPATNYAVAFAFNDIETNSDPLHNYYNLLTLEGNPISATDIPDYVNFTKLMLFKTMRFLTEPAVSTPTYVSLGDKIWVDGINLNPPIWNVFTVITPTIQYPTGHQPFRTQEPLINTHLFESASVFNTSGTEIVQLPIYDPFKFILPGPAKQNITYISLQDPATYNVTSNERLFSENITFSEAQVGKLWWDISSTRFVYYEQPIALDGSETSVDNLIYRRDHWAQLFPGSTVAIYEWVKSSVPPAQYTGTGVPRDITSYVQVSTSNRFTGITEVNYYFWVIGATDRPNIENRTVAATDVARLLQNPKNQGFAFFSPIQQTSTNNSYMFYNVQEILAYQGDNIQLQYRISKRDDQEHTQWAFFREGDPSSLVTDQFWNKMVDSLCGYTKVLPVTGEFSGGIVIANFLPWDIFGWDVAPYDDATALTSPEYGEILPVPDPTLGEGEKYGILYRPRQGMFVKLQSARKIFVQSANELLKHIPIRDSNPGWNVDVATDDYWAYTNWYEIGYEDAIPTIVYPTLVAANAALVAGQLTLGTILQVVNGTVDGRYILYAVVQVNPNVPTLSLNEVAIENSAIKLLNTVYTAINKYGLSVELRELLNAFRTQVMVDAYIVDQNELFFSLLNYVVSEQKNPNWVFKSSYIFIKEDNLPLTQDQLYIPDQIQNVIDYITDVKPYHTQIRDYSSTYITSDIAPGTATDFIKWAIKLQFGPNDADNIDPYANSPIIDPMIGWDFNQGPYNIPWDALYQFTGVNSSGYVVTISDTTNLYPGMQVEVTAGTGLFVPNTFIVSINSSTTFTVSDLPTIALSGADIDVTMPWDITNIALVINQFISGEIINIWTALESYTVNQMISYLGITYRVVANTIPGQDPISFPALFSVVTWSVISTPLTFFDATKVGFSQLFPYTFDFNDVNLNNPQSFITPFNVVGIQIGNTILTYGEDYYVEYNNDGTYTAYFFNDPGVSPVPVALVWFDGGAIQNSFINGYRNELAAGTALDDLVINVDTKLPVDISTGIPRPYVLYGDTWDAVPDPVASILIAAGGADSVPWDQLTLVLELFPNTISFKENANAVDGQNFYRNAFVYAGTLVFNIDAPTESTENLDVITVYVDPLTHPGGTDILPNPGSVPGVIWIDGERIEYGSKTLSAVDTWELKLVRRGTMGTAPTSHLALVPEVDEINTGPNGETILVDPPVYVPNYVWVEKFNVMPPTSDVDIWNASDSLPDPLTPLPNTNVTSVAIGGLWYAYTVEANFLKQKEGKSIP
jgi:hypothetical protein